MFVCDGAENAIGTTAKRIKNNNGYIGRETRTAKIAEQLKSFEIALFGVFDNTCMMTIRTVRHKTKLSCLLSLRKRFFLQTTNNSINS